MPHKPQLYAACVTATEQRIRTIRETLDALAEAKNNETKSSVGDKYETGRAMLQIEEEKGQRQLLEALQTRQVLESIDPDQSSATVRVGSLVRTDRGNYYVAIGIGKVVLDGEAYYCVSVEAPLVRAMLGKQVGDEVAFNGVVRQIKGVT
jgi:transcription elongation GreA/GreB family factor